MTRAAPGSKRLLIASVTMIVTNFLSGCFYSSPQLVPPPSPVSVRGLDHGGWALDLGDRRPVNPPAVQLVALRRGWEPETTSRDWRYIVIHHTATSAGDVESIDAVHRGRIDGQGQPWLGIGYHFVIGNGRPMADGEVQPTFRWSDQLHGAHAGNRVHNEEGIGICLIGDFEQAPPTERQMSAARELVQSLARRYGIPQSNILPHSQVTSTRCPGAHFPWDELLASPTDSIPSSRQALAD